MSWVFGASVAAGTLVSGALGAGSSHIQTERDFPGGRARSIKLGKRPSVGKDRVGGHHDGSFALSLIEMASMGGPMAHGWKMASTDVRRPAYLGALRPPTYVQVLKLAPGVITGDSLLTILLCRLEHSL